jgi:hypothetical protein
LIPPDASVLDSGDICSHLSHRKFIYEWNQTGGKLIFPEYIVIDRGMFGKEFLTPEQNSAIDNYLSIAGSRGYKIIAKVQNSNFLILTHPK